MFDDWGEKDSTPTTDASPKVTVSVVMFAVVLVLCVALSMLFVTELPFPIIVQTVMFALLTGTAFMALRKMILLPAQPMTESVTSVAASVSDNGSEGEQEQPVHSPITEPAGKPTGRLNKLRRHLPTSADKIDAVNKQRGTRIPRSLPLARDEKIVVSERLHWMKLSVPTLVLMVLIVLYFYIPTLENEGLQVIILAASAVYILVPIVRGVRLFISKVTWIHLLMTAATLVILGVMLRHDLADILASAGGFIRDLALLIGWDAQHIMVILIILSAVRLAINAIEWYVNPSVGTDQRLIVIHGLVFHTFPSMQLDKMTDQNFVRLSMLPFGKLKLESAGQEQSLTTVSWFPVSLYEMLRTGASIDKSGL